MELIRATFPFSELNLGLFRFFAVRSGVADGAAAAFAASIWSSIRNQLPLLAKAARAEMHATPRALLSAVQHFFETA